MANARLSLGKPSGFVIKHIDTQKVLTHFIAEETVVENRKHPGLQDGLECCLDGQTVTMLTSGASFERNGDLLTVRHGNFSAVICMRSALDVLFEDIIHTSSYWAS